MRLFEERPLGGALAAFLCAFSLFALYPPYVKAILFILSLLPLALAFLRRFRSRRTVLIFLASALAAGLLLSALYFDVLFPVADRYDGEQIIDADIESIEDRANGRTLTLSGVRIGKVRTFGSLRAVVNFGDEIDGIESPYALQIGDHVQVRAELSSFGKTSSGFDFDRYYAARGYSATAEIRQVLSIRHTGRYPLSARIEAYRRSLCEKIEERAGSDAGGLLSAVLLGERERMDPSLQNDIRRIGISHLLAISGMHLSVLSGFFDKFLRLLRLNKRVRRGLIALFALGYMALVGFPPSVVRAGVMLIIASLLFLLGYGHDSMTSLLLAVTLIVLVTPYAAQDTGLWLSFFACFGILFSADLQRTGERASKKKDRRFPFVRAIWRGVRSALLLSLFAILSTSLFTVMSFGAVSLLSPLSTPIFGWLIEFYLFIGILLLLLGGLFPVGQLLLPPYAFIRHLAARISDIPDVYVSARSVACMAIGALAMLLFLLVLLFGYKRPRRLLPLFCALTVLFLGAAAVDTGQHRATDNMIFCTNGRDDCFILTTGGKITAVDCTPANVSSAYYVHSVLLREHLTECDTYVFTSYSGTLDDALNTLLSQTLVRRVCLPFPKNEAEAQMSVRAYGVIARYRAEPLFYRENETLGFFDTEMAVIHRDAYQSGKTTLIAFFSEEGLCTYFSAGSLENEQNTVAEPLYSCASTWIFGCHGNRYQYYHPIQEIPDGLTDLVIEDRKVVVSDAVRQKCRVHDFPERVLIR